MVPPLPKENVSPLSAPVAPEDPMIARPPKKEVLMKRTPPTIPPLLEAHPSKETLKSIHDLIRPLHGREYAILPDAAIYWVKAPQKNPLPTSWPLDFELSTPELFNRFTQALETRRGRLTILVAKVKGFNLADKPAPDWYKIVPYVESHFHKVGETQYWAVYE